MPQELSELDGHMAAHQTWRHDSVSSNSDHQGTILTFGRDRATYDAESSAYVTYTVASSVDAPAALTFGPSYMTLASKYAGSVVLGLNRGANDIANTIAAAKIAVSNMANLIAIELGNEPECTFSHTSIIYN